MGLMTTSSASRFAVRTALVALTAALALTASAKAGTTVIYNNTATFSGSAFTPGGAVGGATEVVIEGITAGNGLAGMPVTSFEFTVGNLNSMTLTVNPIIFFYGQNAGDNGPGAIIADYEFSPVSVVGGTVASFIAADGSTSTLFNAPSGTFYVGEAFANGDDASATNAQLNDFGVGLFGPPTVGSASSSFYTSSYYGSNPPTSEGTLPANDEFGLELIDNTAAVATPEPGSLSLLGLGLVSLGGMVRRKMRRA